jgi:hypothetical protein
VAHCPAMGAQEGFSCAASLQSGMFQLLQDAQSSLLFSPAGELLCEDIRFQGIDCPRAVFLPEACNLPVECDSQLPLDLRIFILESREPWA